MEKDFGTLVKQWRKRLHFSQQEFCLEAGISTKHLSYLETNKSQPSETMVRKISHALNLSDCDETLLMEAAKLSPQHELSKQHQETEQALQTILNTHNPNPAIVLNFYLEPIIFNKSAERLIQKFGINDPELHTALDYLFHPKGFRHFMENWQEVASICFQLIKARQDAEKGDTLFHKSLHQLLKDPELKSIWQEHDHIYGSTQPIIPIKVRHQDKFLSFTLLISTFGLPSWFSRSVDEHLILLFYPSNEDSREFIIDMNI